MSRSARNVSKTREKIGVMEIGRRSQKSATGYFFGIGVTTDVFQQVGYTQEVNIALKMSVRGHANSTANSRIILMGRSPGCKTFLGSSFLMLRSHLLYGEDTAAVFPQNRQILAAAADNLRWSHGRRTANPYF